MLKTEVEHLGFRLVHLCRFIWELFETSFQQQLEVLLTSQISTANSLWLADLCLHTDYSAERICLGVDLIWCD